jgi:AcrR family transcriptional regulator
MQTQGGLSIQRICELVGVSRASFYRSWEQREPSAAEAELREKMQQFALTHRSYGYRRIIVLLKRGVATGLFRSFIKDVQIIYPTPVPRQNSKRFKKAHGSN